MIEIIEAGPTVGKTQCSWCWTICSYNFEDMLYYEYAQRQRDSDEWFRYYIFCPECQEIIPILTSTIPQKWQRIVKDEAS